MLSSLPTWPATSKKHRPTLLYGALARIKKISRHKSFGVTKILSHHLSSTLVLQRVSEENDTKNSKIRSELGQAHLQWPLEDPKSYVPINELHRIVNSESIGIQPSNFSTYSLHYDAQSTVNTVVQEYRKIFAILVLCSQETSIHRFMSQKIDDTRLPLKFGRNDELFSTEGASLQLVEATMSWDTVTKKQFVQEQNLFLPIIIEWSDCLKQYTIRGNCAMPFIPVSDDSDNSVELGGYGKVFKVRIHPAHFIDSRKRPTCEIQTLLVAVKTLHAPDIHAFQQELKMLTHFRGENSHSHLIELIAAYEHNGEYHLIFPKADCNLNTYWRRNPSPSLTIETSGWVLHQIKGLASGLQRIHGYMNTIDACQFGSSTCQTRSSTSRQSRTREAQFMRHGDIKGDNILCFETAPGSFKLVFCDFGLSQAYDTPTGFRPRSRSSAGTPAYASPESTTNVHDAHNSRSYDMWGLGCVFLEFVIWHLYGWEELQRFGHERGENFFDRKNKTSSGQQNFMTNKAVARWMREIRQHSECSRFHEDLLDVIFAMLEIDPKKRLEIGQANHELSEMQRRAEASTAYLRSKNLGRAQM